MPTWLRRSKQALQCHIELIRACAEKSHCITNVGLTAVVGVSVTSNMTGTEVDTNGQIRSPRETSEHGTCLLAADQTWEDCNPAWSHREEEAAESLDSRGKAKNK